MSMRLKKFLFDKYGGFADKRYKKIENDVPFKLDDTEHDVQDHVCGVFARVLDNDKIRLSFTNNAPYTQSVFDIIGTHSVIQRADENYIDIIFEIKESNILELLSCAIKYGNLPYYKWARDRVCEALDKFQEYLSEYKIQHNI